MHGLPLGPIFLTIPADRMLTTKDVWLSLHRPGLSSGARLQHVGKNALPATDDRVERTRIDGKAMRSKNGKSG